MKELEVEKELRLLHRQVEEAFARWQEERLELRAALDTERLEVETLRRFLAAYHPSFAEDYAAVRRQVAQEVDPERAE